MIRYALEAMKKICKKYRYMFRSDALYSEMNYMIEHLSGHLLLQANNCMEMAKQQTADRPTIEVCLSILNNVLHIIESILSQEELPDFYEDNLENIAAILSFLLEVDYPQFQPTIPELVKCRQKSVRLVHMYQFKFSEFFQKYSQFFFDRIWGMVINKQVPSSKSHEKLIQAVIRYLSEMAGYQELAPFFKTNMLSLFSLLIVPNISITEDDLEEYEFEPESYVRNDLEESDTETRRRQCMKFVQGLAKRFSSEVNQLISDFVNQLLGEYTQNRDKEWIKKTTVLNLIITASIGQYTYRSGAEQILIPFEMLASYLDQLVMPELSEEKIDNLPLLKATCIKFIYMFRNQLPDQYVPVLLDKIADFLRSQNFVNQSYAAACIEKLLLRKQIGGNNPIFTPQNVDLNMLSKLLQGLCEVLQATKNLYAVRSLYRTVQLAQDNILPFAETMGQVVSAFIDQAAKDEAQSSPNYIYILFETAALTLRHLKGHPQAFQMVENYLSPTLNYIMEKNITDMIGFAFQLYALFVAASTEITQNYRVLNESILQNKNNWEKDMRYLIPALGSFLIAMIYKYPQEFTSNPAYIKNLQDIVGQLMQADIRMEQTAMSIAGAIFEKLQGGI